MPAAPQHICHTRLRRRFLWLEAVPVSDRIIGRSSLQRRRCALSAGGRTPCAGSSQHVFTAAGSVSYDLYATALVARVSRTLGMRVAADKLGPPGADESHLRAAEHSGRLRDGRR